MPTAALLYREKWELNVVSTRENVHGIVQIQVRKQVLLKRSGGLAQFSVLNKVLRTSNAQQFRP